MALLLLIKISLTSEIKKIIINIDHSKTIYNKEIITGHPIATYYRSFASDLQLASFEVQIILVGCHHIINYRNTKLYMIYQGTKKQ